MVTLSAPNWTSNVRSVISTTLVAKPTSCGVPMMVRVSGLTCMMTIRCLRPDTKPFNLISRVP